MRGQLVCPFGQNPCRVRWLNIRTSRLWTSLVLVGIEPTPLHFSFGIRCIIQPNYNYYPFRQIGIGLSRLSKDVCLPRGRVGSNLAAPLAFSNPSPSMLQNSGDPSCWCRPPIICPTVLAADLRCSSPAELSYFFKDAWAHYRGNDKEAIAWRRNSITQAPVKK